MALSATAIPNHQTMINQGQNFNVYTIAVKTSDKFGAGTDANVYAMLIGANSSSESFQLKSSINHRNKFERKHSDVFVVQSENSNLGEIQQVKIWHDNTGPNPGWHLEVVEVRDPSTNTVYTFPCNRWLAKNEDDCQLCRILQCKGKRQTVPKHYRLNQSQQIQQTQKEQQQRPALINVQNDQSIPKDATNVVNLAKKKQVQNVPLNEPIPSTSLLPPFAAQNPFDIQQQFRPMPPAPYLLPYPAFPTDMFRCIPLQQPIPIQQQTAIQLQQKPPSESVEKQSAEKRIVPKEAVQVQYGRWGYPYYGGGYGGYGYPNYGGYGGYGYPYYGYGYGGGYPMYGGYYGGYPAYGYGLGMGMGMGLGMGMGMGCYPFGMGYGGFSWSWSW